MAADQPKKFIKAYSSLKKNEREKKTKQRTQINSSKVLYDSTQIVAYVSQGGVCLWAWHG